MRPTGDGGTVMSFSEYDMWEESAANCGYRSGSWFPSMESAKKLTDSFFSNTKYIIWLLTTNDKNKLTGKELEVYKFIEDESRKKLILV